MANLIIKENRIKNQSEKRCPKCRIRKSRSEFCRDNRTKDGLCSECRSCRSTLAKQYRQEHKKRITEYSKKYRQKNKEKESIRHKIYEIAHKKEKAFRMKIYRQTEAGKASRRKDKYRRRALELCVDHESFDPAEVLKRDGYICQHCGKKTRPGYNQYHPLYPNVDHIIPLSKGGPNTKLNTQCLCHQCNLEKNNAGTGDQLRMFG